VTINILKVHILDFIVFFLSRFNLFFGSFIFSLIRIAIEFQLCIS
jgi:hypothetical protein